MPVRESHPPGTPSWVDIGTDVEAAKAFYGGLFGWEAMDAGPIDQTGGYGYFTKNGRQVAGYGPQQNPGPPFWATYICVEDAEAAQKRIEAAGGTTVMPAMQVVDAGSMAVFTDPGGAFISVWQPARHTGAQLVNEPGTFSWSELNTRDLDRSLAFYREVFGWEPQVRDMPTGKYVEFELEGRSIGGALDITGRVPDAIPPHWLTYFGVDDADAALARATELGGSVLVGPFDTPAGRFGVVSDPQGAFFAVVTLTNPGD